MYAWGNNGDARTWFPCVDNADQRCTWDMQFITTRFIRPAAKNSENFDTIVVSNGDLVKQVCIAILICISDLTTCNIGYAPR